MGNIPIPDSVVYKKPGQAVDTPETRWKAKQQAWRDSRSRRFNRAPIYYKLLKNPLLIDKNGLMIDYMRAFNDVSDVVEYERPNKYNFKLVSR